MSRSVGQVLCWAQRRLGQAGIVDAKLEARLLVADVLDVRAAALIAQASSPAPTGLAARLAPCLDRRVAGEPLAHILGHTEFYGLPMRSDSRALIPRSDSETVIDLALELVPDEVPVRIADLGTGSGCLILAVLANRSRADGEGIDLSAEALALARENAELNRLSHRLSLQAVSWTDWLGWSECDLVVSNPPYIARAVIETLQTEVRDHDPRLALDGGPDGLAAYRQIARLAGERMRPGAWLVLEIGHDQDDAVAALLRAAGFSDLVHRCDLGQNARAIAARRC